MTASDAVQLHVIDPADDDALGRWIVVHNAVEPRPLTLAGWRAERTIVIDHLELIATLDGMDAGVAECGWGTIAAESKTVFLKAWVLPSMRRRGVGSALVDRCEAFARDRGMAIVRSFAREDDEAAIRFAAGYGLEVTGAGQVGLLDLTPAHADARAPLPDGVEMIAFAERPNLERAIYDLDILVQPEIPTMALEPTPSFEAWQEQTSGDPGFLRELSVMAVRDERVLGSIQMYDNADGVAFIGMTAVHPDERRHGIARALKVEVAARAARSGWRQIETYNDGTNERMRALNVKLGYEYRPRMVNLKGPLPAAEGQA